MLKLDLEVLPRESVNKEVKKNVNQMRREGWIPGVIYGHGEPSAIVVDSKILNKAIHGQAGMNAIFTVKLGDKSEMSIIKEIQRDIFTSLPIHVDFQRISMKEKIEITLPVHLHGEANGVKNQGGILDHMQREIRVRCLPADLPASIDVEISKLDLHQAIKVADLVAANGVEFVTPADHIIVHVMAPKVEEVKPLPGAEGAVAAQPEVITKGKKDEEGAAAAAAAPADKGEKKK